MQRRTYDPNTTYRLQFHKDFTFDAFEKAIPYLKKLGIKTVYASPIFKAVPGSVHGYDIVDPLVINPEIGTLDQLYKISGQLKDAGIGWLQDIVPNHMAFHMDNIWLMDVFEKGSTSTYARYFDIDWHHPLLEGKVMSPILGKPLPDAIKAKELTIVLNEGKLGLKYFDTIVPLNQASYSLVVGSKGVVTNEEVEAVNNDPNLLQQIIDGQYYLPCLWQDTDTQINYRRFFTINGLISLNIQDEVVFNDHHSFIRILCDDGIFQGLRVDHIDGLSDPEQYLQRLREMVGDEVYISVEKILEYGEELPSWPIQGTTGYDYLAIANNLFTNTKGETALKQFYDKKIADGVDYTQTLRKKKKLILDRYMGGDLENLYQLFLSSELTAEKDPAIITTLKKAIAGILIECPVYRYYGNKMPLSDDERAHLKEVLEKVTAADASLIPAIRIMEEALLIKPLVHSETYNTKALKFYQRLMQFTGPLMAKGGEDTAMYLYNSFIGHNDVGDTPEASDSTVNAYHRQIVQRQKWPHTMNTTATHDTKRGEDARARLNVLTDIADVWLATVNEWRKLNVEAKQGNVPDKNDEYFIYQSLVAFYPMPGQDTLDFNERFSAYIEKALREAKKHTNWADPDESYESAVQQFLKTILDPRSAFMQSFEKFLASIADAGIVNSLSQLVLKFTSPGVADMYQGGELWDLSMVDPDNRRPVDYELRAQWLDQLLAKQYTLGALWQNRYDGKIKLWFAKKLFKARNNAPNIFNEGLYVPLQTTGKYKQNILSYARVHDQSAYIVAVPVNILPIAIAQGCDIRNIDWADTMIMAPDDLHTEWTSIQDHKAQGKLEIPINELFTEIPIAIYESRKQNA